MTDYTPRLYKVGRVTIKTWTFKQGRARDLYISSPKWKVHLSWLLVVTRVRNLM